MGVVRLEGSLGRWVGGPEFLMNSNNDYILSILFQKYVSFNGRLILNHCDKVEQCFQNSDLKSAVTLFYREMCLWDVNDGRCIEVTKLACTHTGIQVSITFCNWPSQHNLL